METDQLAFMRSQILETYPDSCVILSVSNTANGKGGFTVTETPVTGGTVLGRLDSVHTGQFIVRDDKGGKLDQPYQLRLTLPYNAPITKTNRVRVNGITYKVVDITLGDSWKLSTRANLEALT